MTKKLVLIDGHALVHRAFHALPPSMSSPAGVPTNAVYGFISVLIKTIKDLRPEYIVATFDLAGPTFRHEEFAEYKAHREKAPDDLHVQVPLVKDILGAFGVPVYEKEGFEADDLIGSIAEITKKNKDIQTIIATGDLDTLQLVEGERVIVSSLKGGINDIAVYDEKRVEERYGIKPKQMVDFKGLKGDPSDNIPGVPGVGDKTASALIQAFGNIENLYNELESYKKNSKKKPKAPLTPKMIEKLSEHKDIALFSKKLATIIRDVPIQFDIKNAEWKKGMKKDELGKMLQDLGIYSLLKRINELDGQEMEQPALLTSSTDSIKVNILSKKKEIEELFDRIKTEGSFAFDISDSAVVFAFDGSKTFVVDLETVKDKIQPVFEDEKIKKTGHDLKELSKTLMKQGIHPERSREGSQRASTSYGIHVFGLDFDTKIAAYLLNSDLKDYALDRIYFGQFNLNIDPDPLKRPAYAFELKKVQWHKLKSLDLLWVFEKIEVPLAPILAEMEI